MSDRGAPRHNHNARIHGGYEKKPATMPASATGAALVGVADSATPKAQSSTAKKGTGPLPSLPSVILDLYERQKKLAQYIDTTLDDSDAEPKIAAMNLYGQNASRLARMIRMTDQLGGGEKAQRVADAINSVLDALSAEFGIDM